MEDFLFDPLEGMDYLSKILIAGPRVHATYGGPEKNGKFCGFIHKSKDDMGLVWHTDPIFSSPAEALDKMNEIISAAKKFYETELRTIGLSSSKEKPAH